MKTTAIFTKIHTRLYFAENAIAHKNTKQATHHLDKILFLLAKAYTTLPNRIPDAANHPVKKTIKKLKSDTGCKGIC